MFSDKIRYPAWVNVRTHLYAAGWPAPSGGPARTGGGAGPGRRRRRRVAGATRGGSWGRGSAVRRDRPREGRGASRCGRPSIASSRCRLGFGGAALLCRAALGRARPPSPPRPPAPVRTHRGGVWALNIYGLWSTGHRRRRQCPNGSARIQCTHAEQMARAPPWLAFPAVPAAAAASLWHVGVETGSPAPPAG